MEVLQTPLIQCMLLFKRKLCTLLSARIVGT